ncbi:MAG: hypothetical protein H6Q15_2161 [Bacteroidetes bacterium]|nr:hypothetical protein [Bacteroidota bacterium]
MGKNNYIEKGICIWCMKKEPEVTFSIEPHTISRQLGATMIGFDICDSCNHYFGTVDRNMKFPMSVELAFKEIMNLMRILLKGLDENTYKKLKSTYFSYFHSTKTIRINKNFKSNPNFLNSLTRQFKKGMYEVFLQEYHRETKKGHDIRFNYLRNYVRYDKGELPLYFLENNGVYLVGENIDDLSFKFPEKVLSDIDDFGFYTMMIYGNIFFLEVTPRAELSREIFLTKHSRELIGSGFIFKQLRELKSITDIDFTLRKLYGQSPINNNNYKI